MGIKSTRYSLAIYPLRYRKGDVMLDRIVRLMGLRVTSESRAASIGSIIMYIGGIAICILSILRMTDLQLNESQLIFGLLLIICVTMQMFVGGMLLNVLGRLSELKKHN